MKVSGKIIVFGEGKLRIKRGERNIYLKWLRRIEGDVTPGDLVTVVDDKGEFLATGFYEGIGAMAARILTTDPDEEVNEEFFRDRLLRALKFRKRLKLENSYRLCHSEADMLPGLIVDVYSNISVVSSTSIGMDRMLSMIGDLLMEILEIDAVYVKNDGRTRKELNLPVWRGKLVGNGSQKTVIEEGNAKFRVNVLRGQKTGFFLDQRENRILISKIIPGGAKVLDLFSYTGGFGIHAALGGAEHVIMVDESEYACEEAKGNAVMNGVLEKVSIVQSSVRDWTEAAKKREKRFDIVIADPPALIPSRDMINTGTKTYFAVNTAAIELVERDGLLFTFSCSHFMSITRFRKLIMEAAQKAGRRIQFLGGVRGQARDHPIDPIHPWTAYLKGYLVRVW
ncbi:MAG TPA: class I SAM-dependent rRNA methyltransferase [Candidatus Korarchaeota archaeon]|nr:class I SAM-dependent rRNA methyltransferase [Candidatus Korarchaeota archaeon]